MNKIDLIRMGLGNLLRRKARTLLTVLGVVIGTASIITMLSLGFGMRASFQEQISSMGSVTVIEVMPAYDGGFYGQAATVGGNRGGAATLDDKMIAKFNQLEGVEAVTPEIESYVRIVAGKYVADLPVRGIYPETMAHFVSPVQEGRLLQQGDSNAVVFGGQTVYSFMDPKVRDPWRYMGPSQGEPKVDIFKEKLSLTFDFSYGMRRSPYEQDTAQRPPKLFKIKAVGLLQEDYSSSGYAAYMDINQLKKLIQDNAKYQGSNDPLARQNLAQQLKYQRAKVKVKDIQDVEKVQTAIKEMGFQTFSLNDILDSVRKQSNTLQLILGGIGAISLLVAALGITNTMIMSIYERTKEIGVMKVIGASLKDIKRLFLFEAGLIGFFGGLLGTGISYLLSFLINTIGGQAGYFMGMGGGVGKISIIPLWLILAVIVFSILVGLISGYYPARRAMKLSALEAIRSE